MKNAKLVLQNIVFGNQGSESVAQIENESAGKAVGRVFAVRARRTAVVVGNLNAPSTGEFSIYSKLAHFFIYFQFSIFII